MLNIKDNKVYVEGNETRDPEYIGMAVLDMIENFKGKIEINVVLN